jgi:hypothetical protein
MSILLLLIPTTAFVALSLLSRRIDDPVGARLDRMRGESEQVVLRTPLLATRRH